MIVGQMHRLGVVFWTVMTSTWMFPVARGNLPWVAIVVAFPLLALIMGIRLWLVVLTLMFWATGTIRIDARIDL